MRFNNLVVALLASGSVAHAVQHEIPSVRRHVDNMMEMFERYTHIEPPSKYWWRLHGRAHSKGAVDLRSRDDCAYWMEDIKHQGIAAFNEDPDNYQVFRNVMDYGATGNGVDDDTYAINRAISSGGRCGPGTCSSSTTTPAVVYFPLGTYMINASIVDYYNTQLIGNARCPPMVRAFATFSDEGGLGMIDGNKYGDEGLGFGSTNVFWRQIRNFILDMTLVPATTAMTGIHWPTAQATSIQNVLFEMSAANGTQHQGIFIEEGSGGFMTDLTFNGGLYGGLFGNQQFTMRNLLFRNVKTAISQIWDWGWTYYGISIVDCDVGLDIYSGGPEALSVGSVTFFDSAISNTRIGIRTGYTNSSQPPTANSLIVENVSLLNVPIAIENGQNRTQLAGTPARSYIAAYGQGHAYQPTGPNAFQGFIEPVSRPVSLLQADGRYYQRSKPQYEDYPLDNIISAQDIGATGNGRDDDTVALQKAIYDSVTQGKVLFVDHGDYLVSSTIYIPAGAKIVGETFSVILSYGEYFNDISNPQPVVRIGNPGESGVIEWSDMIVSTQGQQRGAVLFEYNLNSPSSTPSGIWDVHARIGGFTGSNQSLAECPATPNRTITTTANSTISANLTSSADNPCIAAYLSFHITSSASGLYMENDWIWTADHDIEDPDLEQITLYTGRGLLVESELGVLWFVGTSVEHHVKYEYQFVNTKDIFAGQIQTETAYYQPNPPAPLPFPYVAELHDPMFPMNKTVQDRNFTIPASDGWGLRIVDSSNIAIYGAGLYSFFNNYDTMCSDEGNGAVCQNHIFSVEGEGSGINVYNLNTVGTHYQITIDGREVAFNGDNKNGFVQTIALFRDS